MKFKLKRIDWYIIKQFLGTYIFAIALIIAISVVFDINEKIDKFLNPDVPLKAIIFDYYWNFIPYFANLFSPLFTFIAVIFFTSKLADNSEVIAMLASGMSFRRLMLPYVISAGIIALSTFILNAYIIPPANKTRIEFQNKYIKNKKVDYVRSAQLEIEQASAALRKCSYACASWSKGARRPSSAAAISSAVTGASLAAPRFQYLPSQRSYE